MFLYPPPLPKLWHPPSPHSLTLFLFVPDPSSSVCSLELSHWRLHSNNDSMDSAVSLSSLREAATLPNRAQLRRIALERLDARDPVARILIEEGPAVLAPEALFVPVVPDYGGGI